MAPRGNFYWKKCAMPLDVPSRRHNLLTWAPKWRGGARMTKKEAVRQWREDTLPLVKQAYERDGRPDLPARSEAWNDWTDGLCKDGVISLRQYERWSAPPECSRRKRRLLR